MEKYQDIIKNVPEKTIIVNEESKKSFLVVKTKGATMVEDIHKAFKEMQQMAGIQEKEEENK